MEKNEGMTLSTVAAMQTMESTKSTTETSEEEPPPIEGLQGFPQEIILAMFSFLTPRDLANVAATCHLWRQISADDELWFELYKDTKKKHLLESLPFTSTAHMPGTKAEEKRREQLRWKERFKETFHIRPGTFFDKVELNLDKDVCEEGGDLSGDMVVTVASEKLRCHGIFVRISGEEKSFAVVGRSVSKSTQDLGEWNYPVYGSSSWESRQTTSFILRRGIYHVPFSFPVSTKGKKGEVLRSSRASKGRGYHVEVKYSASSVLVVDKAIGAVRSVAIPIRMLPRSPKENEKQPQGKDNSDPPTDKQEETPKAALDGPIRKTVQKEFLFGGSATISVTLNKQSFTRGEDVNVVLDVDNKSSYAIKTANITLNQWFLYQSGFGESHKVGATQSHLLDLQKGVHQVALPFTLRWEDGSIAGANSSAEAPVKRGYYVHVTLAVPYAMNPELLIPITLLQPYPH